MKAIRVHQFGGIDALVCEDVDQPTPGAGQVLVRVEAAGVGPWDAWVRNGISAVAQRLPGIVERAGPSTHFEPGDVVYGVTNAEFTSA